jgi:hypothetical protein
MDVKPHVPSSLATVHTTGNPALRAALESLPKWRSASSAWDLLVASARQLAPVGAVADLADEIRAGLDNGSPLPADLYAKVTERIVAEQVPLKVQQLLNDIADRFAADRDGAVTDGSDAILGHLHGQLLAALDVARKALADLGGARTPAQALQADAGPAWKTLNQAAEDVAAIRAAQTLVVDKTWWSGGRGRDPRWPDASIISNTPAVFPTYARFRSHGYTEDGAGNRTTIRDPRPERGSLEHVEWLATSGAQPWVPTRTEYDAAAAELTAVIRAAVADDPAPTVDSRRARASTR